MLNLGRPWCFRQGENRVASESLVRCKLLLVSMHQHWELRGADDQGDEQTVTGQTVLWDSVQGKMGFLPRTTVP